MPICQQTKAPWLRNHHLPAPCTRCLRGGFCFPSCTHSKLCSLLQGTVDIFCVWNVFLQWNKLLSGLPLGRWGRCFQFFFSFCYNYPKHDLACKAFASACLELWRPPWLPVIFCGLAPGNHHLQLPRCHMPAPRMAARLLMERCWPLCWHQQERVSLSHAKTACPDLSVVIIQKFSWMYGNKRSENPWKIGNSSFCFFFPCDTCLNRVFLKTQISHPSLFWSVFYSFQYRLLVNQNSGWPILLQPHSPAAATFPLGWMDPSLLLATLMLQFKDLNIK